MFVCAVVCIIGYVAVSVCFLARILPSIPQLDACYFQDDVSCL